ncbi:hypothetical protein JB92DRAFT_513698 [Gautieria morchelliformis]|nr:hypothetical protein JB92DRAFT_513698 [Gautieria morchelliformis]
MAVSSDCPSQCRDPSTLPAFKSNCKSKLRSQSIITPSPYLIQRVLCACGNALDRCDATLCLCWDRFTLQRNFTFHWPLIGTIATAAFFALHIIGGHVGLPILLLFSIFSNKAQRDPTFLNSCFTWIFPYQTIYRLVPSTSLGSPPFIHSDQGRLTQAAMIPGAQIMADNACVP